MSHRRIVRHDIRQLTFAREHDPLQAWLPLVRSVEELTVVQQREFIVRSVVSEGEFAVVSERVRVLARAEGDVGVEQAKRQGEGFSFVRVWDERGLC